MLWVYLIFSILVMAFLAWQNYRTLALHGNFEQASGFGFGDLFRREIQLLGKSLRSLTNIIRPTIAKLLVQSGFYLFRKGTEMYILFSKSVFGKLDLKKGKTASFFVKHIREFKEELAKDEKLGR